MQEPSAKRQRLEEEEEGDDIELGTPTPVVQWVPLHTAFVSERVLGKGDTCVSELFRCAFHGDLEGCMRVLGPTGDDFFSELVNVGTEKSGFTPLHAAIVQGHVDVVRFLVSKGADVESGFGSDGATSFYVACKFGVVEIARILQPHLQNHSKPKQNGMTPAHVAAQNGHIEIIDFLASFGPDIFHTLSDSGSTPLHLAAHQQQEAMVEKLISLGSSVDVFDDLGWSPIHVALQGQNTNILRMLIKAPFYRSDELVEKINRTLEELIQSRQTMIREPFHSIITNRSDITETLVRLFRVNVKKTDEYTPLMVACRTVTNRDVYDVLYLYGANTRAMLEEGVPSIMIAAKNGVMTALQFLCDVLPKHDITVSTNTHNWNALHWASKGGHAGCVRYLLSLPSMFEVDGTTINSMTPLYIACHHGRFDVVKCLIEEFGANANHTITTDIGCLYTACKHGHFDVVKYLIEGQHVTVNTTRLYMTPLHTAAKYNHLRIVRYLENVVGMSIELRNQQGWSPVHNAARNGCVSILKHFVMKYGAENVLNMRTTRGIHARAFEYTPLQLAVLGVQMKAICYLVSKGADVMASAFDGSNAIIIAEQQGLRDISTWLKRSRSWSRIHFMVDSCDYIGIQRIARSEDPLDKQEIALLKRPTPEFNDTPFSISVSNLSRKLYGRNTLDSRVISLVIRLMDNWNSSIHNLYPPSFQKEVLLFLMVINRKEDNNQLSIPREAIKNIFQYLPR